MLCALTSRSITISPTIKGVECGLGNIMIIMSGIPDLSYEGGICIAVYTVATWDLIYMSKLWTA